MRSPSLLFCSLLLILSACSNPLSSSSGGGGGGSRRGHSTRVATDRDARVLVSGRYVVVFASEATSGKNGMDWNGDGDFQDEIAFVQTGPKGRPRNLRVAAQNAFVLGDEVFVVVDELRDSGDWNLDGLLDDRVLLHWSRGGGGLTFVSTLAPTSGPDAVVTGGRLYFSDVPAGLMGAETTLSYVEATAPTVPLRVLNAAPAGAAEVRLLGVDEDLLFLYQSEPVAAADLNADGDTTDGFVLALLDTTDPAALLQPVSLALGDAATPLRARNTGPNDWLVGFLVDEAAQGMTNFNAVALFLPAWQPTQCFSFGDGDTSDRVLHFLHFASFLADPIANPPVNTGLVGTDRILAVRGSGGSPGFVATLSFEGDEGSCSLNREPTQNDTDQQDTIFRWVEAQTPVLPVTDVSLLLPVRIATKGGTSGAAVLGERFVVNVNETFDNRDLNGDGRRTTLLGWLDPFRGTGTPWVFDHSAGSGFWVGAEWMAESPDRTRLLVTLFENVTGIPLTSGDGDTGDSVPASTLFDPSSPDSLVFRGPPVAAEGNNAGMFRTSRYLYYRVHECDDRRDWNRDKDTRDLVLMRSKLNDLTKAEYVTTLIETWSVSNTNCATVGNPPPTVDVFTDGDETAALIRNEGREKKDFNKDKDRFDYVVHTLRL